MTPVRAHSLVAQIHDALRARIAAGDFPPGTAVSIADIAKQFAVSATPVREALARLAAAGQLRFVDNIGYSVPALPATQSVTQSATQSATSTGKPAAMGLSFQTSAGELEVGARLG